MNPSLPHRPWWRDDVTLAWRTDSSVVVGDGVRRVQVGDVHHELIRWLLSLQGQWTLDEALEQAEARGLGRAQPRRLLRSIAGTGGLDDASVAAPLWREAGKDLRDRLAVERSAVRHAYGQAQRADDHTHGPGRQRPTGNRDRRAGARERTEKPGDHHR